MNDWDIPFRNPKITLIKTNIGAIAKLKGDNFVKYISQTDVLFLSLCDGTRTIKEITNKLADIYKVNSTKVLDDIKKLIGNSLTKNFISLIPVKMQKRLDYFENWKECNGGCHAFSYAYSGIFNSPDPRCSKLFGKENELFVFNYLKGV